MTMNNSALLIIDVQKGLDDGRWGVRNNPDAEDRTRELLGHWRRMGRLVVHVQHVSQDPRSPLYGMEQGVAIKDIVKPLPSERVFQKHVNSAFIGTGLESYLRDLGVATIVVAGLTTDHCVSTTVRMAGNLGFETYVIADATAAFGRFDYKDVYYDAEIVHTSALASLHGEFAEVIDLADFLVRL